MLDYGKEVLRMEKFMLPHRHGEGQTEEYLREQLDRPETFQNVADTFRLLDDTSRVRIFWLLCHCEECVINISAMVDMSSPAVSHHLRQLKANGLIVSRREGKEVYYRAADTEESQLLHQAIEQIMEISCPVK
jgi:Predicted transcriptional regulators